MPARGVSLVEGRGHGRGGRWVGEHSYKEVKDGRHGGRRDGIFVAIDDAVGIRWLKESGLKAGAVFVRVHGMSAWGFLDAAGCFDDLSEGGSVDWAKEGGVGEDFWAFR